MYVRKAIEEGRVTLERLSADADGAQNYAPKLEKAGFVRLDVKHTDYTPQKGDVVLFQPIPGKQNGHMQMFNGKKWVSDHMQSRPFWPSSKYENAKVNYAIYRP